MTKKEYCLKNPAVAYYSGFSGLEIHGFEYGVDDFMYRVSGAWGGDKAYHRLKIYYPADGRKSFYGKAVVIEKDNGETVLQSYDTEVCKIDTSGKFIRLWDGYSATTMRHVNAFIDLFGIPGRGVQSQNRSPTS